MNCDDSGTRWIMLRTTPGCFPVVTDTSIDIYGGAVELRSLIDNYLYDDMEGTVYTIIDTLGGKVEGNYTVEAFKRAVRA